MAQLQIKFVCSRAHRCRSGPAAPFEQPVEPGIVRIEHHGAAGTDREHDFLSAVGRQCVQQRRSHRNIGNAQIARQHLYVRQGVSLSGGDDAGYRRQVCRRFGQHIDPVGVEFRRLEAPPVAQDPPRETRIQRAYRSTRVPAEQADPYAGNTVTVAYEGICQPRIKDHGAAAQLILIEAHRQRLDL